MVQSSFTLLWIVLVSVHFILKNASVYFNISLEIYFKNTKESHETENFLKGH